MMRLHDAADDGEAKPGAAAIAVRLPPRLEDVRKRGRRDADARILHLHRPLLARIDQTDGNAAAAWREAHGVGDQVDHDLQQTIPVADTVEAPADPLALERQARLLGLRPELFH